MKKISLLTTGANGLVGSKFTQLYSNKYKFDSLEISHPTKPIDITNKDQVMSAFEKSEADTVVHLAAFTDVTTAWEQKGDKNGLAYQVNVNGTKNILQACQKFNKFLVHVSTAYVFDGEKSSIYTETDTPKPIEWYGQTKYEAEQLILESEISWSILRIDQPFRSDSFPKTDVAHRIINGLITDSLHPVFINHFFGPTFIDDFAKVLDYFVSSKTTGLFHATSGEKWSDYEFAQTIKQTHQLSGDVRPGDLTEYLKSVNRPYQKNTALSNKKLTKILPFKLKTVEEAIAQIKI
jgi:dTDP-4-dehydrorhamnose reductase